MSNFVIKVRSAPIKVKVSGAQGPAGVDDPRAAFGANKATIVDPDRIAILDSANSNLPKHTLWSVIKSTLKAYFDTLYPSGSGTSTGTNTGDQTSVTGNAGTVTTIAGRIAAGANVTLAGAGTAGSPITVSATRGTDGAVIEYSETAPTDTSVIWVDPKRAKVAVYISGGWVILKGSAAASSFYLPYEPETFAYLGDAGIDFAYAEQLDLFIKGLKLQGAWSDCSMWILDTRYQGSGTLVVGSGGIPINGLKENGLGTIAESAEEYYFSRGTARVWTPTVLMPISPLMSVLMVARLPQLFSNYGGIFGGRTNTASINSMENWGTLGVGLSGIGGNANIRSHVFSNATQANQTGELTPTPRKALMMTLTGERAGNCSVNGGALVAATAQTQDYSSLAKDTQSNIWGPGDNATQSSAPGAASFVAFWRTNQSAKSADIYNLYKSTIGSHLGLP